MTEMWHFIANNNLRDGGAPAPVGGVERWDGPVVLCESGLHACLRPLDALNYAPVGKTIQVRLVSLSGTVVHDGDKAAATERLILASADCTRVLHEVALHYAESVRHLIKDDRRWAVLDVKRRWLDGEATDDELAAARDAWSIAWHAVWDGAWDTRAASWAAWVDWAAWADWAASAAANAASADDWDIFYAANAAACAAAWDTARDALWNTRGIPWDAARYALWAAAWDAANAVQNAELERRLRDLLRVGASGANGD